MSKFPFTLACQDSSLALLSDAGQETTDESVREELMARFRAGNLHRLIFGATVWTNGKNRNHYRFPAEELEGFAASFARTPLLKDHSPKHGDRGGTILSSQLVTAANGAKEIRQRIEAVKPWAIESVLDRTLDRFSVGWNPDALHLCSVCAMDILDCKHGPWKLGSTDRETGQTVEILWKNLEGLETSAVTHPAAAGTSTHEVMAALASMSDDYRKHASGNPAGAIGSEEQMLEKIVSALGLPAGAAEAQVLSAVEALKAIPKAATKSVLAVLELAETASEAEVIGKIGSLCAPGAFVARADHEKVVTELAGIKADETVRAGMTAGKLTPAMEPWAKEFGRKHGPAALEALLATMPTQVPLPGSGVEVPSMTEQPKKPTLGLTPEDLEVARQLGTTPEQFAKDKAEVEEYDRKFRIAS